jgi:hypothetical protein
MRKHFIDQVGESIMAFGSTRTKPQDKTQTGKFDPVYLDVKAGKRVIRILSDEISYRVYWLDVNVKSGDTLKIARRPIIAARLYDGAWKGHADENWYKNPYQEYISTLDEEAAKKLYAKTRFIVNVYDRTEVIKTADGVFYPDEKGNYSVTGEKAPHNTVMLLEGSSGKEDGKHLLQEIMDAQEDLRSMETSKPLTLFESDIVISTKGTGIDTKRKVNGGFNQLPVEFVQSDLYDLDSFVKPWPHQAIEDVMNGVEYGAVRDAYDLLAYPKKYDLFYEKSCPMLFLL